MTRTLLGTNLASKYFGKYSKVKHTFKLHTNPTYKNEEEKKSTGVWAPGTSNSSQVSPFCTMHEVPVCSSTNIFMFSELKLFLVDRYYLGPPISLVKICIVNFGKWFRILQIWANDKISDDCPNISLSGDENINPDLLWFWCWTVDTRGVPGPSSRPMDLCHTSHTYSHILP